MHVGWLFGISSINSINPQCINILIKPQCSKYHVRKCLSTPNILQNHLQKGLEHKGRSIKYQPGWQKDIISLPQLGGYDMYIAPTETVCASDGKHAFPRRLFLSPKYKWHLNDKTCAFFCKVQLPFCLILTLSFFPTGMTSYWQHWTHKERK